ncbi:hypothetical protein VAA_02389 [Vibrio anguillarum 775]|nr:hypothetical protein VAA_02389 [Vibrio anguillarum 775]AGU58930.1 hypothetical protein N175_10440 [Vibrio anguillarum M3]ARV27846.1 hypothetical protein A6A12_0752 [Vibrio anguillarum]
MFVMIVLFGLLPQINTLMPTVIGERLGLPIEDFYHGRLVQEYKLPLCSYQRSR